MYNRIHDMMHDYHQFSSRPTIFEMRDVISAMLHGTFLLPSSRVHEPKSRTVVSLLNKQWRSMSNTYPLVIAANEAPLIKTGYLFMNRTSKDTMASDSIIVAGYRPLLTNLMVYTNNKALRYVYFAVKANKFVRSIHPSVGLIPIKDIFDRPEDVKLYSDLPAKNAIESKRHDTALRKIVDEVLDKWCTFSFAVRFCHHLTVDQQDSWSKTLHEQNF